MSEFYNFHFSHRQLQDLLSRTSIVFTAFGPERIHYSSRYALIGEEIVEYTEMSRLDEKWEFMPPHEERYPDSQYLGAGIPLEKAVERVIRELEKQF